MNAIYFHFQGLALKVIRCASVGGGSRNPDRRSHRHTCTTPTVSRLRLFSNVFGRYFLNRTVEHIPSTVMEGFHSLLVWNHSQKPISRAWCQPV